MPRSGPGRRGHERASTSSSSSARAGLVSAVSALGFAAVALVYAGLRTYQFHVADSDENIYFYMALRTAFGGLLPYRDYFFAHPPLHLGFAVAALKLGALFQGPAAMVDASSWEDGGVGLVSVKCIGIVVGTLSGVCIYRAVRRAAGPLEAFIAGTLFLMSADMLHSFFTGIAEALMFAALGLERAVAGRDRQAGLAFAAGCLVAMYVAPCALAVWLVLLARDRRRALTLALWAAVPLVLVHLACLLWGRGAYWQEVFAFHMHKPKLGGVGPELLVLLRRSSLLAFAVPAAVAALWRGNVAATFARARLADEPRAELAAFALASLGTTLLFTTATRAVFHYYFVMLMLGTAPLAGLAYGELLRRLAVLGRALRARATSNATSTATWTAARAPALAAAALLVWPVVGTALARLPAARRTAVPDAAVGTKAPRVWRSSPALGPFDDAVHALLWRDVEVLGDVYPVWTRFLWDSSVRFQILEPFAKFARDGLPPGSTIFGDPTLADAVALQSGRHVALDEADTNFMRFASGITPPEAFIDRLRAAPPAFVLFSVGELMVMPEPFQRYFDREFESTMANDDAGMVFAVMRPRGPQNMSR